MDTTEQEEEEVVVAEPGTLISDVPAASVRRRNSDPNAPLYIFTPFSLLIAIIINMLINEQYVTSITFTSKLI